MSSFRYYFALLFVVFTPGAFAFWFVIHPFAPYWRRVGPLGTYAVATMAMIVPAVVLFLARDTLLSVEYGTSPVLMALALPLLVTTGVIRRARSRHLTFGILAGLPEVSADRYPGRLLTDGIYAHVRHPRYVEILLGSAAWALILNYLAAYVAAGLMVIGVAVLIPMEERELIDRFGEEYEAYRRRVPAIVPRWRKSGVS